MDDVLDSTAGVAGLAAALTAAIFSPRVRGILHQGAVYGVAGVLRAGDTANAFARGVGRGLRQSRPAVGAGDGAAETDETEEGRGETTTAPAAAKPRRRGGSARTTSSPNADPSTDQAPRSGAGPNPDEETTHG
jgi:hypothetical protein